MCVFVCIRLIEHSTNKQADDDDDDDDDEEDNKPPYSLTINIYMHECMYMCMKNAYIYLMCFVVFLLLFLYAFAIIMCRLLGQSVDATQNLFI